MSVKLGKPEKYKIADKIMLALLAGFVIPAVLTSPYAGYAIVHGLIRHYFRKYDFNREVTRLRKRGYVALTKTEQGWLVKLLPKGRTRAKQIAIENIKLPKSKTWDGKWRLFSFDIPEEYRGARNMLRRKIKSLGCYNIQRSLFAYPYDCREELTQIAKYYKVDQYTIFAEVVNMDLHKELKKHFNL